MIRSWCSARKVVAELTSAATRYLRSVHPIRSSLQSAIRTFSLFNERVHNTRKSEGECNRECWRQAAWATRTVGGKYLTVSSVGRRSIRVSSARWPRRGGAGWQGRGRRFSKTANVISGNCEGHLLGKSCKLGYTYCQIGRTFVTAFPSTTSGITVTIS